MDKSDSQKIFGLNRAFANQRLRIIDILGGYGQKRRLLSLGFHKNDVIMIDKKSILGGPLLIKNHTTNTSVALARGIAKRILVEFIG